MDDVVLAAVLLVVVDARPEGQQDERDADQPGDHLGDVRADADEEQQRQCADRPVRPVLEERDPALVKTLDTEFANVDAALSKYRSGDGWKLHNQLTQADLKSLSDAINALAEPISKVAAVIAKQA